MALSGRIELDESANPTDSHGLARDAARAPLPRQRATAHARRARNESSASNSCRSARGARATRSCATRARSGARSSIGGPAWPRISSATPSSSRLRATPSTSCCCRTRSSAPRRRTRCCARWTAVLRADGHLIVLSFAPGGLWGLRHLFASGGYPQGRERVIREGRLARLARALELRRAGARRAIAIRCRSSGSSSCESCRARSGRSAGCRCSSGGYLLRAQKRVHPLTPVRLWRRQPRLRVVGGLVEPTTRAPVRVAAASRAPDATAARREGRSKRSRTGPVAATRDPAAGASCCARARTSKSCRAASPPRRTIAWSSRPRSRR